MVFLFLLTKINKFYYLLLTYYCNKYLTVTVLIALTIILTVIMVIVVVLLVKQYQQTP